MKIIKLRVTEDKPRQENNGLGHELLDKEMTKSVSMDNIVVTSAWGPFSSSSFFLGGGDSKKWSTHTDHRNEEGKCNVFIFHGLF